MSIGLSRVGVSGPLSARSRLIPPFCFAPTEKPTIALSGPRCTSSIGLCRHSSGSYRHESSLSHTDRHNLEVGIIQIAHSHISGAAWRARGASCSSVAGGRRPALAHLLQRRRLARSWTRVVGGWHSATSSTSRFVLQREHSISSHEYPPLIA